MSILQLTSHQGVRYEDSPANKDECDTGKGIRVDKDRWEEEYFTVPHSQSYNKTLDKRFLETGQIVIVRENKSTKKCPYRVERTEYDTYIKIVLTSCHGGTPDIHLLSRGKYGYKWTAERNGKSKAGHEVTVMPVSDEFLVEQLGAEEAYLAGAV